MKSKIPSQLETIPFYNEDCLEGCEKRIPDESVDLIITDPPYGIDGDTLHKHYHRKEQYVLDGYVEVHQEEYARFTLKWILQAERILRPGGSIYILSGYTNLLDILNALRSSQLEEINHIIWKYNFGVYTKNKFVTSHYHILYYAKPGGKRTFNTYAFYGPTNRQVESRSLNYEDREDVWIINREYKPGKTKNKNELPLQLLKKMILYSSKKDDMVCDLFLGGFSTAVVAKGLQRKACGFEISRAAFQHGLEKYTSMQAGSLLTKEEAGLPTNLYPNQGKPWSMDELLRLSERYDSLYKEAGTKRKAIDILCTEFGRGYFSILNALKKMNR